MIALLRLEGLTIALAALFIYYLTGQSWQLFALLILAPDISFAAYLMGPVAGAIGYNTLHSWIGPAILIAGSFAVSWNLGTAIGLVWVIHIGLDRALGYGLKHFSGFRDTHFGRIGHD
jgi:hypothetical protein